LPLAVGRGLGSEMRTGIGIASIGGTAGSAVLTLIVLPIVYDLFTRRARKPLRDSSRAEPTPAPSDTPPDESVISGDKNG